MAVAATLLGSATGSGLTLTIPITTSQPANTVVHVFAAASTGPTTGTYTQGFAGNPTDSEGGTWRFGNPYATIGNTGGQGGSVGAFVAGNVLSAARTAGNPLVAGGGGGGSGPQPKPGCTTCGSELMGLLMKKTTAPGDSVTCTWLGTNPVAPTETVGFVVAFSGATNNAVGQDQGSPLAYNNGDAYPNTGSNPSALVWGTDLGHSFEPAPNADTAMLTLAGGYGVTAYTPVNGAKVTDLQNGALYLALSLYQPALSGVTVEPGGSFTGSGTWLAANYQFVQVV